MGREAVEKAFELCLRASEVMLGGLGWPRMGVLTFGDEHILCSRGVLLPPELLMVSLALSSRRKGLKAVLLLDARREHELNLSGREGLDLLCGLLREEGLEPFYFGPATEGPLAGLRKVKLDMAWLSANPGLLARAVEEASPVKRKVRELAVADLASLSSLLVEKMGPPSFKEDLVARIKGADKASVAADALISVAAITNPTSLVVVGLKYAARFFRLVRERRREEYKAFLEAWKKNVEKAFSREKLSEIIGDGGLDPVLEAISSLGLAVVVHDLSRTPYELFVPLLICDLAEELGGPALMLLDGVSHLSRFGWTIEVLPSLPDEHPGLRLACLIHTCPDLAYERLPDLMRALTDRRAIIFDMDPAYTDALCRGRPASFKAALLRGLEKAAKERLSGNLAFILYDAVSRPLPEVVKVKPSLLGRLKGALKGILAGRGEAKG